MASGDDARPADRGDESGDSVSRRDQCVDDADQDAHRHAVHGDQDAGRDQALWT